MKDFTVMILISFFKFIGIIQGVYKRYTLGISSQKNLDYLTEVLKECGDICQNLIKNTFYPQEDTLSIKYNFNFSPEFIQKFNFVKDYTQN